MIKYHLPLSLVEPSPLCFEYVIEMYQTEPLPFYADLQSLEWFGLWKLALWYKVQIWKSSCVAI
jgi:hypothetical protein